MKNIKKIKELKIQLEGMLITSADIGKKMNKIFKSVEMKDVVREMMKNEYQRFDDAIDSLMERMNYFIEMDERNR